MRILPIATMIFCIALAARADETAVPVTEMPKTEGQVRELANLELLAGHALHDTGGLRLQIIDLYKQIAQVQAQLTDLKTNPAHAVAAATKPGMLFIVTPDGLGLQPATPEEIRKAAGPAPVADLAAKTPDGNLAPPTVSMPPCSGGAPPPPCANPETPQ